MTMKKLYFALCLIFVWCTTAFAYDNLYVVGDACSSGWDPNAALAMTKESADSYTWSGPLKKNSGKQERFKFLVARSWATSLTCRLDQSGHQVIASDQEYDLYVKLETDGKPDNSFQVPETGIYRIDVNTASMKMTCTKIADYEEPDYTLFSRETFQASSGLSLNYRALQPATIEADTRYPLVIFLHGSGERGNDNESQLRYGADQFLTSQNRADYPAFVLFPQCPSENFWPFESQPASFDATTFPTDYPISTSNQAVKELIDYYLQNEPVDPDRVYIVGISMGGMGTFDLACRFPETFAAAVPICGGIQVDRIDSRTKRVYWRLFHGDADGVVPVNNSRSAYEALLEAGATVEYVEIPGGDHFIWSGVFAREDFLPWIFGKRRQPSSAVSSLPTDQPIRCYAQEGKLTVCSNNDAPLQIDLYNTSGARVCTLDGEVSAATPLPTLSRGIYLVTISQGANRYHTKVVL